MSNILVARKDEIPLAITCHPAFYPTDRLRDLKELFPHPRLLKRERMETDENFLQLIPYIVLKHAGKVFCYQRGGSGGEDRLHAKYSIGLGGHIDEEDASVHYCGGINLEETIISAAERELAEEVGVVTDLDFSMFKGLIFDPSTSVGRVHLGLLFEVELDGAELAELEMEHCIEGGEFRTLQEIVDLPGELETWSKLVVRRYM